MKKALIAITGLFLVALLYTSCKGHQTCPAYGKVQQETTNKIPA